MALPEVFYDIATRVNNWGRWGDADEIGTLNLIGDDAVRRAARCARTGKRISLALPLSEDGPQIGAVPGRINPVRRMIAINASVTGDPTEFCTSDDVVEMGLQAATHWDSLAHASYDGRIYNGFPADSISAAGAAHVGIDKIRTLTGRGVLLDVAGARGIDRLEAGYAIAPDDLDAASAFGRVTVGAGDIVLVRTGHMRLLHAGDKTAYTISSPGLSMATALWFHERDVAAVATDNLTFEVYPPELADALMPVHLLDLVEMGMTQGQNFDLEALAVDCAGDGFYDCFLEASPQPFVGGLGSPVNPVAIK